MPKRAFHHGNLRAELLDRAETMLRERGAVKLSLRELARGAGVSHGAPRSHFPDRDALLSALAQRGFDRLADAMENVIGAAREGEAGAALLVSAGRAYMDFAAENPALLALLLTAKSNRPTEPVQNAAARLFDAMITLVRTALGVRGDDANLERLTLVLSASVEGISSLAVSGRVSAVEADLLLEEAIRVFLAGAIDRAR